MDSADPRFDSSKSSAPAGSELDLAAAEDRARQAFGLTNAPEGVEHRNTAQITRSQLAGRSGEDRPRTHFVRNGEVPVVYLPGSAPSAESLMHSTSRLVAAETALASDRQARQLAERALAGAQSALHEAQTRLGHASLARAEADEALQKFQVENAEIKVQLEFARAALQKSEAARQRAVAGGRARAPLPRADGIDRDAKRDNVDAVRRGTGIDVPPTGGEPKPIRWW